MAAPQEVDQHFSLYKIIRVIAAGSYGRIYEVEVVRDFNNGRYDLKKGMRLAMKKDTTDKLGSIPEIDILNRVNHPNIVNVYDTFNRYTNGHCKSIILIIPLASYNLRSYITKLHESRDAIDDNVILDLLHQLLCGLFYLHSNHIIHDDIKPDNILIYEDDNNNNRLNIKITDFGLSATLVNPDGTYKMSQTLWWRPPEILRSDDGVTSRHSCESDVWAMGVVFLELVTGLDMFDVVSNDPTISKLAVYPAESSEDQLRMIGKFLRSDYWKEWDRFTGVIKDSADLISRMLDPNPNTRITSQEALRHQIFTNLMCERQVVETIPWDIGMISASDVTYRSDIISAYKNMREIHWEDDWNALFLGIDIADRYFTVIEQSGIYSQKTDPYFVVEVIDASFALSIELSHIPYISTAHITFAKVPRQQRNDRSCDILEKLNWKLYRPTLYSEHPDIDPEKLFNCYLETTEPTLECVI